MTMAISTKTATTKMSSSAEIATQIKTLLKPHNDERLDAARLDELRKVFASLIQSNEFSLERTPTRNSSLPLSSSSVQHKWHAFLRTSHKKFLLQLCDRVESGKRTALRTLWGVVATSPTLSSNSAYQVVSTTLLRLLVRVVSRLPTWDKSIHHMLQAEFLQPYRDVQYYTLIATVTIANEIYKQGTSVEEDDQEKQVQAERLVQLLMLIPIPTSQQELDNDDGLLFPPPKNAVPERLHEDDNAASDDSGGDDDDDDDATVASTSSVEDADTNDKPEQHKEPARKKRKTVQRFAFSQLRCHHRAWSRAWLAVLRLPLSTSSLKQTLIFLPSKVLPNVHDPLHFADFFMSAYDQPQKLHSVLALDGLFLLITKHGLEYPGFYKQLYKLLTPSVFYVKYKPRFLRLLETCISRNELLPAHIVAAFIKRTLRCCLQAPPASILVGLALCSNWLRKHGETACLVHRLPPIDSDGDGNLRDAFDSETDDPEQAQALQSSLWELEALSQHYYPAVVTMAKSIGREDELQTPLHDITDFLSHTYKSLFEQERKRKSTKKFKPSLTFVQPEGLFLTDDVFAGFLSSRSSRGTAEEGTNE